MFLQLYCDFSNPLRQSHAFYYKYTMVKIISKFIYIITILAAVKSESFVPKKMLLFRCTFTSTSSAVAMLNFNFIL